MVADTHEDLLRMACHAVLQLARNHLESHRGRHVYSVSSLVQVLLMAPDCPDEGSGKGWMMMWGGASQLRFHAVIARRFGWPATRRS